MNIYFNDFDDIEDFEPSDNIETDVCPSCGITFSEFIDGDINDSCDDPSGCGYFAEQNIDDDNTEEEFLKELNFDE